MYREIVFMAKSNMKCFSVCFGSKILLLSTLEFKDENLNLVTLYVCNYGEGEAIWIEYHATSII